MEFLNTLIRTDLFTNIANLMAFLEKSAENFKIPVIAFYIALTVLAAIVGLFGYKMIRFFNALAAAYIGYCFVGMELYAWIGSLLPFALPHWGSYAVAAFFALFFFVLAAVKCSYVYFVLAGGMGYALIFCLTKNILLSVGAGLLLALICILIPRFTFALLTSSVSGIVITATVAVMLPNLEFLQFAPNHWISIAIAGGFSLIFLVIQLIITHNDPSITEPRSSKKH